MFRYIWRKWIDFGEFLAGIFGGVLLTIFYFTIFAVPCFFLSFAYDQIGKCYIEGSYFCSDVSALTIRNIDEAKEM